jgi:uncharacterized membrane protein
VTRATARLLSFLFYLLPGLGWLVAYFMWRRNTFVYYHACQSLGLALVAIMVPVGWAVIAWFLAWIPFAGPLVGTATFALVMGAYMALVPAWLMGIVHALKLEAKAVPVFGGWGNRVFARTAPVVVA